MATPVMDDDRLSETFAALASTPRRHILERLAAGEASVGELAEPLDMTLPAVSRHLKVLEKAGLIVRSQRAQFRPCTLDAAPLAAVSEWAEQYRHVWEARFDRLDDYLGELRMRTAGRDATTTASRTPDSPQKSETEPNRTEPNRTETETMTDDTLRNHPAGSVMIERVFDAPIELVWKMWTEAEHFAAWYGPTGARIPVSEIDLRVGGGRRVCMEMDTPNGPMQMWFVGEYVEIVPNERLVYTEAMADEDGNVRTPAEMGMPDGHPTVTEVIVELESGGDSTTKMTMTHAGVPADSGGAGGWAMAFDKLATHLESVRG